MAPVGDAGRVSRRRRIYVQDASCVVNYGLHCTAEAADENGGRGFKVHLTGMMTGVHVEAGPRGRTRGRERETWKGTLD